MASVAESCEASLPLTDLAHIQAQFLQERVLPQANGVNVDNDGEDTEKTGVNADGAGRATGFTGYKNKDAGSNGDGDAVIDESAHAYRTPISSPKTNDTLKTPRLESAKTTHQADMEAMVNPSPSQEAFEGMTRATSFYGFAGGDTQPLESQVYHAHYESVALSRSGCAVTPKKEKIPLNISAYADLQHTYNTDATGQTPRTLQPGDRGYVDFASAMEETPASPAADSGSELGDSVNGDDEQELSPVRGHEFVRPAQPKTPSLAGHKRRRSGEILQNETSTKKTPGILQAFGFGKPDMMTGTQLFDQTQARSSPMPDAARSDPARTRPSPNIQNQYTASSPPIMTSSPISSRAPPATAGEPRERYITSKESQERKRAKFEQDYPMKRPSNGEFDDEDDEADAQQRRIEQRALKRNMSEQNLDGLKRLSAPSKPRSRPTTSSSPHKPAFIDLRTPAIPRIGSNFDSDILDVDEPADEQDDDDMSLAADEDLGHTATDDQESVNDDYDELAQTVLRSQGPEPNEDEDEGASEEEEEEEDGAVDGGRAAKTENEQKQVTLVQGSSQYDRNNLGQRSPAATQHSKVDDSQPMRSERQQLPAPAGSNGSPSCSYVPGSQYAGRTSADLASLPARRTTGPMGPPMLSTSKPEEIARQVVPSSPPLAATNGKVDNYTAEASVERKNILAQLQPAQQETELEVPESDTRGTEPSSSRPITAEGQQNTESNNAPFSTARSHLSARGPSRSQGSPPPSPLRVFASQQSTVNSQSPRVKAGVRRFADIAGSTTAAPTGSGEEAMATVDALMSDLISAEDQQVLDATSSPPRERPQKRLRALGKPSIASSSPSKEPQVLAEVPGAAALKRNNLSAIVHGNSTAQPDDIDDLETRALKNSPSKANEQRAPSPPPESTPESVKQREQAGAKTASQLLAKRSSRVTKPATLSGTARKAGSKPHQQTTVPYEEDALKRRSRAKRASSLAGAQACKKQKNDTPAPGETKEPEIEETVIETREEEQVEDQDQRETDVAIVAPHRVFALFKGTYNMFYPATWLGVSNEGGHRVRFDDETITSIEPHLVARMELGLGDQVKVDWQGMKKQTWIVKGFGPSMSSEKAKQALTDVHGHGTVKVQAKSTRGSISGPNAVAQGEGEIVNMAVECVYLTHTMWPNFLSRKFQPGMQQTAQAGRLETPLTGVQTPANVETPTSRSRRATISTAKAIEKRGSSLRDESATATRTPGTGLFTGMAFAVSFGPNEAEKFNVTRLIQRNGGTVLEDGFEGLFDAPSIDDSGASSSDSESSGPELRLEHKGMGFVALIADRHSRRAKYVQALALGIPTLSGRWIVDSLDASKNDGLSGAHSTPLAWKKYLLAAGESSYLNGAVCSRDIAMFDAASTKLSDIVTNRPLILNAEGVLIVASKKSKVVWERRKAFAFLTIALGAGHVRRVSDLQEAKAFLVAEPEKWKFVYVDGSVAEASAAVFGKGGGKDSKKRRREDPPDTAAKVDAKAMSATDGKVRIVNDEFVVQSLIFGALVG